MRDPYEVLGVQKNASQADDQERLSAARQEAASRRQQERPKAATRFAELNAAYEIVGDERQAQGLRPRRDRRRRQAALPGLRRVRCAAGRRTRSGRWCALRKLHLGPGRLPPSAERRLAAAASRIFCVRCSAAAAGAARGFGTHVRGRGFRCGKRRRAGCARFADDHACGSGQGHEDARASADRQGCRGQDSGRTRDGQQIRLKGQGLAGARRGRATR